MYRFDNTADAGLRFITGTPDDPVTGDQRGDGTAKITAVHLAIWRFHISMHAEAADNDAFLRFAQLVVIPLDLAVGMLQAALMVGANPPLLTF
ncbi:hypothetical protein OS12_41160 [Dickeya oryzae]